ncbi:MAG: hypothetical protein OK474_01590 [Thaumarchaeota archaeon]|nr:hypothetical protein [Nitrososphaerota archaeon]
MSDEVSDAGERTSELRSRIKKHFDEVLQIYGTLFERKVAEPPGAWGPFIEYRLTTGAAAYYFNEGHTVVLPLELPQELKAVEDELRAHLGAENWERWEALVLETRSHLDVVAKTWTKMREDLDTQAHEIGLTSYEKLTERPLDIFWPSRFVAAIWEDLGYYEKYGYHQWESTSIVMEQTLVPMRHTVDVVRTWAFSGIPWVLTQSRESAEQMKRAWEDEALEIEPAVWAILEERNRLEDRSREFLRRLQRSEVEYRGYRKDLPNQCSRCRPWLDELKRPASS